MRYGRSSLTHGPPKSVQTNSRGERPKSTTEPPRAVRPFKLGALRCRRAARATKLPLAGARVSNALQRRRRLMSKDYIACVTFI